jgi:mono/diheme cytochrome c family protein
MGIKTGLLLVGWICIYCLLPSCVSNVEEELYPPETCDTMQVTYSGTIAPLIAQNCFECHGGDATISGIPLEGYDNLKAMVDAERLVGAVRHLDGFSAMPKDAPSLSECKLLQIEKWVNNGAPDN